MLRIRDEHPVVDMVSPEKLPPEIDELTAQKVIAAYTTAARGSAGVRTRAFDAALRTYRNRHPTVPERTARRRVATVICFAGKVSPVRSVDGSSKLLPEITL